MVDIEIFKGRSDVFTRKIEILSEFFGKEEESTLNELIESVKPRVRGALASSISDTVVVDTVYAIVASTVKAIQEERQSEGKTFKNLKELRIRLSEIEKTLKEKTALLEELSRKEVLSEEEVKTKEELEREVQTLKDEISSVEKEISDLKSLVEQRVMSNIRPFVSGALSAIREVKKEKEEMEISLNELVPEEYEGPPEDLLKDPEDPIAAIELENTIDAIVKEFLEKVEASDREIYEGMLVVFDRYWIWFKETGAGPEVDLERFRQAVNDHLKYSRKSHRVLSGEEFKEYWEKIKPVLMEILHEIVRVKTLSREVARPTTKLHGSS